MAYTPGESGNRRGRPPKGRALTEILLKAGTKKVEVGDQKVVRKQRLAEMLWDAAMYGTVDFPTPTGLKTVQLEGDDWFDVVKFIYNHVDGPPKASLFDVPEDTTVAINFVKVEGRKPTTSPEHEPEADAPAE